MEKMDSRSVAVSCSDWLGVVFQDVVRTGRVRQDGGGSTLNPTLLRTDNMHANATLTPLTRAQMALQHSQLGLSLRTTAVAFGVCEKTVRRWLARAQQAGFPQRLHDHSSRPLSQPRKTSSQLQAQILALRRQRRSYAQISFSRSPRPPSRAFCAVITSIASPLSNLPNLPPCAMNARPQATSSISTLRSSAAFIAQASSRPNYSVH